jgi:hypothetical protein
MIAPVVFMFQILVSGSLYSNHIIVKLVSQNIRFKQVYTSLLQILSQYTLHKVKQNYNLPDEYLVQQHHTSVADGSHLLPPKMEMIVHEERIPNDMDSLIDFDEPFEVESLRRRREQPKERSLVNRKHRLDAYKLYYPGYM